VEVEKALRADSAARKKALDTTFSQIKKAWGEGAIMLLGDKPQQDFAAISTGCLQIDHAIGIGGVPRGRVIEIYGPEASGKTTLALQVIAEAQRKGLTAAFIDAEHALDPVYAQNLGLIIDDLIIAQPDFGEQALEIAEHLIRSNVVDVIVIDSVAALVPKAEVDGEMGDAHIGLQARLMSQALRKLTPIVHRSNAALIFINQVRQNINAMAFANKEVTPGGNALKFYASLRIDVRRIQAIKDKQGAHRGNRVLVKIAKNKMAPPFKKVEVDLIFGEGVCKVLDLIAVALEVGVLKQAGSWFSVVDSHGEEKLSQGREQLCLILKERNDLHQRIVDAVQRALETPALRDRITSIRETSAE
jgi:recombination protein RecA